MKTGEENHRPWVEFEEEECVALDKEFFRAAYEVAGNLRGRQAAFKHRISEELMGLLHQLNGVTRGSFADDDRAREILIHIAAQAARNARLVEHLKTQAEKAGAA